MPTAVRIAAGRPASRWARSAATAIKATAMISVRTRVRKKCPSPPIRNATAMNSG